MELLLLTLTPSASNNRTEVFQGEEGAMKILLQTMSNVQKEVLVCADQNSAAFFMGIAPIKNGYSDFKRRGVRIRFITEITSKNLQYVKELMNYAEVRHMNTVKGNMAVSETEYVATATLEDTKPITQTIYSNAKPILEQQRYFFENLWTKAVNAQQRIMELEEGMEPRITKIIDSPEDIVSRARQVIETSNRLSVCSDLNYLKMIETVASDSIKKILEKSQNGMHKGMRWIGTINKEDIALVKKFLELGMEIKHLRYTPLNFSVTDREFNFTVSNNAIDGSRSPNVLISNELPYIKQFNSLFEELWSQGANAADRMLEIEKGIEPDFFEVINEKNKVAELLLSLSKLAKEEVLFLLPNDKALIRMKKLGVLDALQKASLRGVNVRVICPVSNINLELVEQLRVQSQIKIVKGNESESGIMIIDSSRFISAELVNPNSERFSEAIGVALYSNSKRSTSMLRSFFNSLWNQAELSRRLELQEKIEKEFVNMAAHELRTPVQPLLGMIDILMSQFEEEEEEKEEGGKRNKIKEITVTKEDIEMIARNTKRLERLTSDILDASRIESNVLKLNLEQIDLNEKIRIVVNDERSAIPRGKNLEIIFDQKESAPLFVRADKLRLFEVLSNLIGNAIKFSDSGGTIIVTAEKSPSKKEAIVSIKDRGKGIDKEILPRLFTKFASTSDRGTGLGLYLSKGIVQAHGGSMWAENNKNGIGATFRFTLPLSN